MQIQEKGFPHAIKFCRLIKFRSYLGRSGVAAAPSTFEIFLCNKALFAHLAVQIYSHLDTPLIKLVNLLIAQLTFGCGGL